MMRRVLLGLTLADAQDILDLLESLGVQGCVFRVDAVTGFCTVTFEEGNCDQAGRALSRPYPANRPTRLG